MFALFVVSRTVGLPGYHEPWDKIGIASLVLEALFVAAAIANVAVARIARSTPSLRVVAAGRDQAA